MVTILIFVGVGFCVSVSQYDHIISYICFLFTGVEWAAIPFRSAISYTITYETNGKMKKKIIIP